MSSIYMFAYTSEIFCAPAASKYFQRHNPIYFSKGTDHKFNAQIEYISKIRIDILEIIGHYVNKDNIEK